MDIIFAINWNPWCEEAFAQAKAKDKPIFLSIGYSCCHWWQSSYSTQIIFSLNCCFEMIKYTKSILRVIGNADSIVRFDSEPKTDKHN